jgi:plastocyanin
MTKRYSSIILLLALAFQVQATTHVITQTGTTWSPMAILVDVGDIIQFTWTSGNHTTTSTMVPGGAETWDEPITAGSPTYDYTVDVEGTYTFKCTPHESMGMVGGFVAAGTSVVANINLDAQPEIVTTMMNNTLNIQFSSVQTNYTVIRLIDLAGHELQVLVANKVPAGELVITEDVSHLTNGIYFVSLQSGSFSQVKKILIQ